jgi:hypothetical protein
MNAKFSIVVILAITAFIATAATTMVLDAIPVHADKPQYCSQGGNSEQCSPSQNQCEKKSPGKSGCKSNEAD